MAKLESNSGLTPKLAVEKGAGNKIRAASFMPLHVDVIERCSVSGKLKGRRGHM